MKISYNWLKDYIDIDKKPEDLADDLSLFGHEVESIDKKNGDVILDLEITPNRGDCLSILGIAREIAALYNIKVQNPKSKIQIDEKDINKSINIIISDPKICPRYTCRIIENIEIKDSSENIQERLKSYGFRSVNNIVDITNFVMLATGQPLHAFDYDKIKDGIMNITQAKGDEKLITLDGKNRAIPEGATIIQDKEKIYDLAGIMGGANSEVDKTTKTIVLQGAIFDPVLIRRASKEIRLVTDASYRYERNVDFEGTVLGVNMATDLIKKSCTNANINKLIDKKNLERSEVTIDLEIEKINKLLGTNINIDDAKKLLQRLNFSIEGNLVKVPSYRQNDVNTWQDLAEEIARINGYKRIEKYSLEKSEGRRDDQWLKREFIKDSLKEVGFTEIYSYSFSKKDKIELLGHNISDCIEIKNPLSEETKFLRPSLKLSLLEQISKNPWAPKIRVFEIGKVFDNEEKWQMGIAVSGNDTILKEALDKINIEVEIENVDKNILDKYKIRRKINLVIIDIDKININAGAIDYEISKNKYKKVSKFSPTIRDLAFIVDEKIDSDEVRKSIKDVYDSILLVELFDEFKSDKFGENKKNLAYHIWLQDLEKPMEEGEVEKIVEKIVYDVTDKYGAKLRSK